MKIFHIITGLKVGGAEMMLLKLLERRSPKVKAKVISLTHTDSIGKRINDLGIPVVALEMRPGTLNPFALLGLVRLLQKERPDIIHTWMYHADLLGGLAARWAGIPSIIWNIRSSDLSRERNKATTRLVVALCAKLSVLIPNRIQCCSNVAKDIHLSWGYDRDKFIITPNGFDLERFVPDSHARLAVRQELAVGVDTPLVGLIARFDPQKNHSGFFEAAGYLHKKRPDVHFLLAGDKIDTKNPAIIAAIERAGVSDVTHLLGLREDIPRIMASLDVLASSSYGEAFPNVLGEAMACGVPCAVTDVGDSAYIVGNTGKVVGSGDMKALAEALESFLDLPSEEREQIGQQARHRIQENFDISRVVKLYEALYEEVYAS
ncbi:glycosyltransferase [Oscillatoria sp. FACHB-1406]|uniref:glycosyltransferase family 4 protein n=1 Tax=Oscillatoria sp. FACHB-1406 TaxID=2692846 RepID=UPI0016849A97|nr:glycosyltransferase [Oscillatoria sp. FACHB-1406]MBD2577196.1 glycosyltransferase [Oscillatoria sp. FACHB-1406]